MLYDGSKYLEENFSPLEQNAVESAFNIRKNMFRRDVKKNIDIVETFLINYPNADFFGIDTNTLKQQIVWNNIFIASHLKIKLYFSKKYEDVLYYKNKLYKHLKDCDLDLGHVDETEESIDLQVELIKNNEGYLYESCQVINVFNRIFKSIILNNNPSKMKILLEDVNKLDFTIMTEEEYDRFFDPLGNGVSVYETSSYWLYNKIKVLSKYCDVSIFIKIYYLLAKKCNMDISAEEDYLLNCFQKDGYIAVANTLIYKAYMFHKLKNVSRQKKSAIDYLNKADVGIGHLDPVLGKFMSSSHLKKIA